VLSINARIEASRATGSAVFRAIAGEMQQLSKAIAHANKTVYDLSATMARAVPALVDHNQALARLVDGYVGEAGEQIDAVDRQVNELRAAVSTTLAESDDALAQIVEESHAALSDLQFQDVCAQGLLQLDAWLATWARELAAELGVADDIAPAAHATVGDEDIQLARRDAGEVMLF
jgi:ABC-type transporter Mla subunit MlaD